jgi:translation initiation factor 3 subunit C
MNETIAKQKSGDKKLNASQARGFNAAKQRIKKNNKDYANLINKYRKDKDDFMESDDEEAAAPVVAAPRITKLERIEAPAVDDDDGFATVGRGGKTLQYTPESILKHLRVIVESRGKKNTDRLEQIRTMEKLLEVAQTPYQRIRVYLTLISTRFDLTSKMTRSSPPSPPARPSTSPVASCPWQRDWTTSLRNPCNTSTPTPPSTLSV